MLYSLLYIDPGTGSMLFSILIALATTAAFGARVVWMKMRFIITRGKKEKADSRNRGIVIYSDDKRYWNVFGPICREAERRGVDMVYMTQSADDRALTECTDFKHIKAEFIGEGNKGIAKMNFLVADIVLATTPNLDVYQWKRSREVKYYVHTQHGVGDQIVYRMFALDYYDAVLLASEFQGKQIRTLEALRGEEEKELRVVGYPPLDEAAKRVKETSASQKDPLDIGDGKKTVTVLVAPSWGENSLLSRYGARLLKALLQTGYTIIVRPHPQTVKSEKEMLDALMEQFPEQDTLHWNFDTDNFECLRQADIMLSDFSSVIFEYAFLFERPVIYTEALFDTGVMDAAWMPNDLWYKEALSEIGIRLGEEELSSIKSVIDSAIASEKLKQSIAHVKASAWQRQGEGTVQIVDYLVEKQKELLTADITAEEKAVS